MKRFTNLLFKVVVDDIFHVDGVKVVGPWMEYLEAFVFDTLISVSIDIIPEMFKIGLVSLDWVTKIVLVDGLSVVS